LDPEVTAQLLEGHTCTLPELYRPVDEQFEKLRCPKCGSKVERVVDTKRPFTDRDIIPNYLARCPVCDLEMTPEGIITKTGGIPKEGPNPSEGMSTVDPRNTFIAEQAIEQVIGSRRGRPGGSG